MCINAISDCILFPFQLNFVRLSEKLRIFSRKPIPYVLMQVHLYCRINHR